MLALALAAAPAPAWGVELSGGVSLGGILAGAVPRFALSPHAGVSWRWEGGLLFAVHDLFSVLPPSHGDGFGVYNQTSAAIGYASGSGNFILGPSLALYSMPVCDAAFCGRVVGLSPGGHAQADVYFADPLGLSVDAHVAWLGGRSLLLPGGLSVMVVAGPVLRWSVK